MKFLTLCILTIAVNVAISQDVGSARRRRTLGRSERAKKLKYFLKKHGRLEGMIRLVDGTKPSEGIACSVNPLFIRFFYYKLIFFP